VVVTATRVSHDEESSESSESSESEKEPVRRSRTTREKPKERKIKTVYVSTKGEPKPVKPRERRTRDAPDRHRSPTHVHRSSPQHIRHNSAPEHPQSSPPKRYACEVIGIGTLIKLM
jgi:hypothetical protein